MKQLRNQKGFAVVEILIVIVIIAVLAAAGWWVYNRNKNDDKPKSTSTTTSTKVLTSDEVNDEVPVPKNASDLKKLDTQLNDASLGDTNVSNLNSELDF